MDVASMSAYAWLSARARNAVRRRAILSITTGGTFVVALIGLVLIPRQANRAARTAAARIEPRPDTTPVLMARTGAAAELAGVDSALAAARETAARARAVAVVPPDTDTLPPELRAERDSLSVLLTALTTAMEHAATAPLPPAFRALAQTPALHGNSNVRVWLDSLDQVDKLRAPFGALGAGDPIYIALTARVNELGRSIRDAAELRRSELRARLAPLTLPLAPVAPPPPALPVVDTAPLLAQRAAATQRYTLATRTLDSMRAVNARIDAASTSERELANLGAPPAAMLAAALVIALAVGFATTFAGEVRRPRVAHTREAEAVTHARVLSVIRQHDVAERSRRQTDLDAPPLVDLISDTYRVLYLHLAATDSHVPIVTITGDSAPVVAAVATNLAAVASYEGRSTLLVDVDPASNGVASVLRIPSDPGVSGVLAGRAVLAESIVSTTIGRDRPLDVLPSGSGRAGEGRLELIERLRADLTRLERRYDFTVIAAPMSYVQLPNKTVIPARDVVVCARVGATRLAELRAAVKSLRGLGRYVHGIVLWDEELPRV